MKRLSIDPKTGFNLDNLVTDAIATAQNEAASVAKQANELLKQGKLKDGGAFRCPFDFKTTLEFSTESAKWLGSIRLRAEREITLPAPTEDNPNATRQQKSSAGLYAYCRVLDKNCYVLCNPNYVGAFANKQVDLETDISVSFKHVVTVDPISKANVATGGYLITN